MKKNAMQSKIVSYMLILTVLGIIIMIPVFKHRITLKGIDTVNILIDIPKSSYNDTSSFSINGDDEFESLALVNSWDGNGSQADPFIIANLNITTSNPLEVLINVTHTRVYFKIKDCLLVGGIRAVSLTNVSNANIKNNTVYGQVGEGFDTGTGFYLENAQFCIIENNSVSDAETAIYLNSGNCTIKENILYNNADDGITCDNIGNNTIVGNIIFGNGKISSPDGFGIRIRDSQDNNISENEIYGNSWPGLYMANAGTSTIEENVIYDNLDGIELAGSNNHCNITKNMIYSNHQLGIKISGSNQNISKNTIYNNSGFGLRIISGTNNKVTSNNFIDNVYGSSVTQATADNPGNVFDFNFWSEWTFPDDDKNEITDLPYAVGGDSGNYDSNPKTIAYSTDKLHILTRPQITYPNDEVAYYADMINITWGQSSDTFEHVVNYSVYYSQDDGFNWIEIITGISEINYIWDSSVVEDGEDYKIKVISNCDSGLTSEDSTGTFAILEHKLTTPTISYPNGGELISGSVNVEWNMTFCSWEHNITYRTYYSTDGISWIEFSSVPYWDTSILPDGSNYTVMVVATCTEGKSSSDVSDGVFSIGKPAIPSANPNLIIISSVFGLSYVISKLRKKQQNN